MDDLISRQDAIDIVRFECGEWHGLAKTIENGFNDLPSIDAVPVIRCKDCKYYGRVDKRRFYRGGDCTKGIIYTIVPDKDFCSRGERKES